MAREVTIEIDLDVKDGMLYLRKSRIRAYGGFLFKQVRLVIEEEYSDFAVIG
jgi:hypothetical protein